VRAVAIGNVLTRTTGYLKDVTSHSLQPYRGCSFGRALCGVGCYVRHNGRLTRGEEWGSFLDVRRNAPEAYASGYEREKRWARGARGRFSIFMSSSTDPYVPQEKEFGVTRGILERMLALPPDLLIVQTHADGIVRDAGLLAALSRRCDVRAHLSIESDLDRLPGLPPPACSVARRLAAASALKGTGPRVVVTVAPLLPIADPDRFFARLGEVADAVVLDHFIGGDGSPDGSRTLRTPLPTAMAAVDPAATGHGYLERMASIASRILPGRVGIGPTGFAGRYEVSSCSPIGRTRGKIGE
jgi:DNA repair photolyase